MTAPHFHTTAEARSAIKKIEHNSEGGNGKPSGIAGGSAGNNNADKAVMPREFDGDSVTKRGIRKA